MAGGIRIPSPFSAIYDGKDSQKEKPLCQSCWAVGIQSTLQKRIYRFNKQTKEPVVIKGPEADKWLMCPRSQRGKENQEMSLCYDFQKWTVLSLGLTAATLIVGLVLLQVGHGQTDNNNTQTNATIHPIAQFFNDYNGIFSVAAILIGIFIFFYQLHSDKKQKEKELHDMIRQYCETIQNDTKQIKDNIAGKASNAYTKVKRADKNIEYTRVFISTNVYQSVLHSGVFTHFEMDTQINLDNLYYIIEGVNDNHKRLLDKGFSLTKPPPTDLQEFVEEIQCSITKYQKEILRLSDLCDKDMKHELQKIDP